MANTVIGVLAGRTVDTDFLTCLLVLMNARVKDFHNRVILTRGFAGRLDKGRETIARQFLEATDGDYLLTIDSDMVFDPEDYDRLLEGVVNAPNSVVSGLYPREDGSLCVLKDRGAGISIVTGHEVAESKGRWFEADAAGLGFCLTPRSVFEALDPEDGLFYSNYRVNQYNQILADDTSFFYLVRKNGIPVWVDKKAQIGHLKQVKMATNIPLEEKKLVVPGE